MPDHIFFYWSAAITLAIVILSLLTPRPGRERERQRYILDEDVEARKQAGQR
jgi:hypothetical protein